LSEFRIPRSESNSEERKNAMMILLLLAPALANNNAEPKRMDEIIRTELATWTDYS
jgi:hypothetical protein